MTAAARRHRHPGRTAGAGVVPLFLLGLVLQVLAFEPMVNPYDEGIILLGAERVLRGEIPYRDFWTMYGPGQFYLLAGLFSVFGVSDLTLRGLGLVAKGMVAALCYLLVRRCAGRLLALAAWLVVLGLVTAVGHDGFPVFPALGLALASVLLLDAGLRRGPGFLLAAGLCTGLATTFRHDLGFYNAVAVGGAILLAARWETAEGEPAGAARAGRRLLAYAAGVLLVVGPVTALLLDAVPLADLEFSLLEVPARIYPVVRSLPFPPLEPLLGPVAESWQVLLHTPRRLFDYAVYAPFLALPWVVVVEVLHRRRRRREGVRWQQSLAEGGILVPALIALALVFILKGLVRVSTLHMIQALVPAVALLAIGLARMPWRSPAAILLLAPGLVASLLLLLPPLWVAGNAVGQGQRDLRFGPARLVTLCTEPPLPRLRCMTADAAHLAAVRYVMARSDPDSPVFVGAGRHDRLLLNAVALYFLMERGSVTKWHELHPGIQTTAAVQRAMIAEMRQTPPRFVLLDSRWDAIEEPNASARSGGVTLLDDYLAENFATVKQFGPVRVLAPRPGD